ncbi:response regulator [Nitrincola alkalilacustris]|uniref:response regulator n=1 Tax=Nitrincola alkalilacustris TaxID=1571224 RepID=UPI00124DE13B|nr:response regulator [Nitrincola alkalilacustris]
MNRFTLLSLVMILSVTGLIGADIWRDRVNTLEAAYQELENLARIASSQISGSLRAVDLNLQDMVREANQALTPELDRELSTFLRARAEAFPEINYLSITDEKGVIQFSSSPDLVGYDASDRPYYQRALEVGVDRMITTPPVRSLTDQLVIFAARPRSTESDLWKGVVVASLSPEHFSGYLEALRNRPTAFAALIGPQGHLLARAPHDETLTGRDISQRSSIIQYQATSDLVTRRHEASSLDGKERLMVMRDIGAEKMFVNVSWSTDDVFVEWRGKSIVKALTGMAFISLMLFIISRLRRRERQLLKARDFAENLIEGANVLIVGQDAQGRIGIFNEAAEQLTGYSRKEVLGKNWNTLVPSEDAATTHQPEAAPRSEQSTLQTRDKQQRIISWRNSLVEGADNLEHPLVLVSFGMDITDRVAAEIQLERVSERLKLVNRSAGMGVWQWEIPSNNLWWDDRMAELYQEKGAGWYHLDTWKQRVHPEDYPRTQAMLEAMLAGKAEFDTNFRIIWPDGEIRHMRAVATVEYDAHREKRLIIGMNWDITEQKRLEDTLREAREAAEAASRMKSEFVANMSHEIRTPMTAVMGVAHLLEQTEMTPKQHDYVQKINTAARSLLAILNDILDYSKVEAGKMELSPQDFNLDELLSTLATMISVKAEANDIEVLFRIAPDVPDYLWGDDLRLQQVLINLLGNAIKFTEKGQVVLEVNRTASKEQDLALEFRVTDTGIGMSEEHQSRLFQAFQQADTSTTRRYGGTGLGLTISHRLVHLLGGDIQVKSEEGKGSCFTFTLPFKEGEKPAHSPLVDNYRTLVVDDNEVARQTLAEMCQHLGWEVTTAASGEEALTLHKAAYEAGKPFELVLMDWRMPGIDGLEAATRLRSNQSTEEPMIVLVVTAFSREMILSQADESIFDGIISKPATPSLLRAALATRLPSIASSRETSSQPLAGMRLLVTEDNPINQEVARDILKQKGADVILASTGREALDILTTQTNLPDLVLMDVQMPEMDGLEATRRLRQDPRFSELPIVAMTANVLKSDRDDCLRAGMNDHIAKPLDVDEMISKLLRLTKGVEQAERLVKADRDDIDISAFPVLPGIDTRAALKRLDGKMPLLWRLLGNLTTEFAEVDRELADDLNAGQREQAAHRLHALRGAAANLGAQDIAEAAATLEAAIKDAPLEALMTQLATLKEALEATFSTIRAHLDEMPEKEGLAPDISQQEITRLQELLAENDFAAVDLFSSQRPALASRLNAMQLIQLDAAMARLDFPLASRILDVAKDAT